MNRVVDFVPARFCWGLTSVRLPWLLILVAICLAPARGQETTPVPAPNEGTVATSSHAARAPVGRTPSDQRYRIGPGDVLDVKVFNKPQFTREGVKVDQRGRIRMPLVKEEIEAACHTEEELEANITELLKEFIREPQVTVQIKEYLAEPVAVLGAVRAPSRFQLQRRVSLLEILTYVNGPADNAGRTIQVVHTASRADCEQRGQESSETLASQIDYYKLSDTLRGEEKSNPYLRAGDVVSIPLADQVFVIGNVIHPTALSLTEPMTVSRAIAMAGGTAMDTKKSAIQIIRQIPGTTDKKEILVDLDAINRHKAEDVVLLANDIVDVPASGGKRFLRSLMGAVVPGVGQLPVRVIP